MTIEIDEMATNAFTKINVDWNVVHFLRSAAVVWLIAYTIEIIILANWSVASSSVTYVCRQM